MYHAEQKGDGYRCFQDKERKFSASYTEQFSQTITAQNAAIPILAV